MSTDYIPHKDLEFNQWVTVYVTYVTSHATKFNLPAAVTTNLTVLKDVWDEKYARAEAPETRTKAVIKEKDKAREALVAKVRQTNSEYLTFSHLVTDADRDNMGLPIHKTTRTPVPPPTKFPEYEVGTSVIRQLTVHFRDQGSTKKAKPEGVHGAEIRWAILGAPPLSIDELIHSSFDTRSPFTLVFDESQRGKTVYFCLCWENTTGAKGPWSEIVNAIIP
jgi:hypothetical protein